MKIEDLVEGKSYRFSSIGKPAIYRGKRTNKDGDGGFMFDFKGERHPYIPDEDGLVNFGTIPNVEPIEDETSN